MFRRQSSRSPAQETCQRSCASGTATTQPSSRSSLDATVANLKTLSGQRRCNTYGSWPPDTRLTLLTATKNPDMSEAAVLCDLLRR